MQKEHKIVIVGGGFGGVRCALDLEKMKLPNTKIVLVTDKPHFEYHAALYRVVVGKSPLEVCLPLREIFKGKNVEVVIDSISSVDHESKVMEGTSGSHYTYDVAVLALGSETIYFNIPGLKDYSFGFKSIYEAIRLKDHLHTLFESSKDLSEEEIRDTIHVVIVGGGASGVELAGEIVLYVAKLCKMHAISPSLGGVTLVEGAPRLLPALPEDVSARVLKRLTKLGVDVHLNKFVTKEDDDEIFTKNMVMKTKTVIWTSGVIPHHLYKNIKGLQFDEKGRVLVSDYLEAKGYKDLYILGDAAATRYSGIAQTALLDASHVARVIRAKIKGTLPPKYRPQKPVYAIPVGPSWAAVLVGSTKIYGRVAWWIRRFIDFRFFLSFLSLGKAISAWRSGKQLCESCSICLPEQKK